MIQICQNGKFVALIMNVHSLPINANVDDSASLAATASGKNSTWDDILRSWYLEQEPCLIDPHTTNF